MSILDGTIIIEKEIYNMSNFEDVMIDLETLGTGPGCIVLSIGAVAFNPEKKELGPEFYQVFNTNNQWNFGLRKDADTVEWWESQTDEAREVFEQAKHGGEALRDGLLRFNGWLSQFDSEKVCIWGNGADFDNAILQYLYRHIGMLLPWKFWNNRCFRTLYGEFRDLYPKPFRKGIYHNALDDAKFQAGWANDILYGVFHGR